MSDDLTFLDLFAGAGGLSEGFIQAGFEPVAHVESDRGACFTLRTRMAYHWLKSHGRLEVYTKYLNEEITRLNFYEKIPEHVIKSIIEAEISNASLSNIFQAIDARLNDKKLDLIVGGPPCQAYSLVGRSRDQDRMKSDERNYLYLHYAKFLERYQPSYFIFENVRGLLSATDHNGKEHFSTMRGLFAQHGYETEYQILSADDYGVLQDRKRVFLVGRLGTSSGFYPKPDSWQANATVAEAFSDLPPLPAGGGHSGPCCLMSSVGGWTRKAGITNKDVPVTWHQARPHSSRDLEIYHIAVQLWNSDKSRLKYHNLPDHLKTHKNRVSFSDRFKVVASDLPSSHTVVAHIAKDGHYYIHPDIQQNRSITPREAARLQTFPDDYYFETSSGKPGRTSAFRQIGNAVPVLLARQVAEKLKETWT